jgi:hypothetical protein
VPVLSGKLRGCSDDGGVCTCVRVVMVARCIGGIDRNGRRVEESQRTLRDQ